MTVIVTLRRDAYFRIRSNLQKSKPNEHQDKLLSLSLLEDIILDLHTQKQFLTKRSRKAWFKRQDLSYVLSVTENGG